MSYGLNKVMLIGHLGADPELRYTEGNIPVATFNIATNESYKDQSGNLVDRTEWHRIVAWRKLAELFGEYLKKGSKVYIEGKLQTRSWDDKDGNKRYTTEVVCNDFMFLDSRGAGDGGQQSGGAPPPSAPASGGKDEDDLPF
ncbi:MAG: single-stranded DNA-binding protein [Ignavibacteria bacterium]|nr:MAG: single-stranded DNA-binding protein [Ignavibacteria bacterium]